MPTSPPTAGPAASIASGTSFPSNPSEGDAFYRTDQNTFYIYDGTSWVEWEIETHADEHEVGGADQVTGILIQDLAANRPAAGVANRFFLATDTMELSRDNGTAWESIGVLGGLDLTAHEARHESGGADAIPAGSLNAQDPTAHETSHESGGADALPLANLPMPGDDTKIQLGAGPDFSIFYDSTNNDFRIRDEINAVETNLPKNVAMNLASHAARHEPGGADVTDAYLAGESAGLREEHGSVFSDEVASNSAVSGTVTFTTAFSAKPLYLEGAGSDTGSTSDFEFGLKSTVDDEDPLTTSDF